MCFTKVKGHPERADVQQGIISQADRLGNHQADFLATAGAKQHAVASEVVRMAKCCTTIARSVQSMMADILEAKRQN